MKTTLTNIVRCTTLISPLLFSTYFIRFKLASIPFTFIEIFIYVVFGLWLISIILNRKVIAWDKKTALYMAGAFLIFIGATIGVVFAPDSFNLPSGEVLNAKQTALGIWKGWIVAPIIYFVLLVQVLRDKKDVRKTLQFFIYSAVLLGLISLGFAFLGEGFTYDMRLRGFYESANYLALYIGPALLINVYFVFNKNITGRGALQSIPTLLFLSGILFSTRSYGAIISIFGALFIFFVYRMLKNPKNIKKILITIITILSIFTIIILTQINTHKFKQSFDFSGRSSTSVRLELYKVSYNLLKENSVTGIGPGLFQANYQTKSPHILGKAPMEWNMSTPHNTYLTFWLYTGLIGLLGLLLLLILSHTSFTYPLIALWGIMIHGLVDIPFWKNDLAMIFWLIIACVLVLQKDKIKS